MSSAACGVVDNPFERGPSLERCFDAPQPVANEGYDDPADITVSIGPNGLAQGDPLDLPPAVKPKVVDAIVEIHVGGGKGSGFITSAADGSKVVVTAAHVVGDASPGDIRITDDEGQSVHPEGGCFVYDNEGQFVELNHGGGGVDKHDGIPDQDIAVLRLNQAAGIGRSVLAMASGSVAPGQWVHFVNYQGNNTPGNPASYTAVVAPQRSDHPYITVISGARRLGSNPTVGQFNDTHIVSGASGGVVTDNEGRVVGVSTAGRSGGICDDPLVMQAADSVRFTGNIDGWGAAAGLCPSSGFVMPSDLVRKALAAVS